MIHVFHNKNTGETKILNDQTKSIGIMTNLDPWTDVYELSDGTHRWVLKNSKIVRSDGSDIETSLSTEDV